MLRSRFPRGRRWMATVSMPWRKRSAAIPDGGGSSRASSGGPSPASWGLGRARHAARRPNAIVICANTIVSPAKRAGKRRTRRSGRRGSALRLRLRWRPIRRVRGGASPRVAPAFTAAARVVLTPKRILRTVAAASPTAWAPIAAPTCAVWVNAATRAPVLRAGLRPH
jgi:hypothetical protein